MLPYLEQDNLYRAAHGTVAFPSPVGPRMVFYPGNENVYSQPVPIFLCPSDPSIDADGVVTINGVPFGASCYAPNGLISGTADFSKTPPVGSPQGRMRLTDIGDGTSNTILHAEKYARCSNTYMAPAFGEGGTAWAYCTAAVFPWQPPPMTLPGKAFQPGFCIAALAGRGAPDAIGPRSIFQVQPAEDQCDPTRASTPHPGGIQVGLADGSVRMLTRDISEDTWWTLVTPRGGEVLGPDW